MTAMFGWMGRAQTAPEQVMPDGAYTLHVYTDLLQVPTIVLTPLHSDYRALTKENFTLSLDGGPRRPWVLGTPVHWRARSPT